MQLYRRFAIIKNRLVILVYCYVYFIGHYIFCEAGSAAKKILRIAEKNGAKEFSDDVYRSHLQQWETWGLLAIITPLAALAMMVFKVPAQSGS